MSSSGIFSLVESECTLHLSDDFKSNKIRNFMKQFILSDESVNYLKTSFDKELDEGLQNDKSSVPANVSKLAMGITYFTELFDGTGWRFLGEFRSHNRKRFILLSPVAENFVAVCDKLSSSIISLQNFVENGEFVVMNLTVQNLILVLATVRPGFSVKTVRKYFTIDETVRRSPYMKIFEYLCECLLIFFTENNLLKKPQTLGFATDLPMIRFGIDKAIINYFTISASEFPLNFYDIQKCFEIILLKERYKDIQFILVAVVNNNMSLLIQSSYMYGPIDIFLNLEDDCDLIYKENLKRVQKWKPSHSQTKYVFIDTELRNFGRSGTLNFMATELDWSVISEPLSLIQADKDCRLEKFLSEKYVLELIRHILVYLHHELVYCRTADIGELYKVYGISIDNILNFMKTEDIDHATQLLPGGTIGATTEDALIAKYVCKVVFIRAALLISICLSCIVMRFHRDNFAIVLKCPLIKKYLTFEMYIRTFMEVLAPKKKIFTAEDSECVEGAVLATSIIHRQEKEDTFKKV